MAKLKNIKQVKKEAWRWFSKYIRLRSADSSGRVKCVTCGKLLPWRKAQAGHFVGGRGNAVLFDEELVHCQCVGCNIFLNGNYSKYTIFMMENYKYTTSKIKELLGMKHEVKKLTIADLEDIRDWYKHKYEMLEKSAL